MGPSTKVAHTAAGTRKPIAQESANGQAPPLKWSRSEGGKTTSTPTQHFYIKRTCSTQQQPGSLATLSFCLYNWWINATRPLFVVRSRGSHDTSVLPFFFSGGLSHHTPSTVLLKSSVMPNGTCRSRCCISRQPCEPGVFVSSFVGQ